MSGDVTTTLTMEEVSRAITSYFGFPPDAVICFTTKTLPARTDAENKLFNYDVNIIDGARIAWKTE